MTGFILEENMFFNLMENTIDFINSSIHIQVWNVRGRRQLCLLKHHKSKVHSCSFSPVPERSNRNSMTSSPHPVQSPYHFSSPQDDDSDTEQPPLVLVTMATEIVWWNITQVMKTQKNKIGKR